MKTQTATNSIPVFVDGIKKMSITDAIGIVKNGGTAATDYLRTSTGENLKNTVTPIMKTALDQYNITKEWDKLVQFYKGETEDVLERLETHNNDGSDYTKGKGPWKLVYTETLENRTLALKREKAIKRLNRRSLLKLIGLSKNG